MSPLILIIGLLHLVRGLPQNLSTIRYQFTTCGQTGRLGPTYQMCLAAYKNTSLDSKNFFFFNQIDTNEEYFASGQGFKIPTSGRYNITLAGAAGGRGICNPERGKGLFWKGKVNLVSDDVLLVLVGQKGRSPCDNPLFPGANDSICENPPRFENKSASCNSIWFSQLNETVPEDIFDRVYQNIGGGGGGGASMIRLVSSDGLRPVQFPLMVAPGGGGSAALANYSVTNQINATFPVELSEHELYKYFMDGKPSFFDPKYQDILGERGRIQIPSLFRSGAGGGYFALEQNTSVDGNYLNAEQNFAEGGFDCARQLFDTYTIESPEISGGFGGGGGQCGCGGSGGGFTGGQSVGTDRLLPGEGGYFYVANSNVTNDKQEDREIVETSRSMNKLGNGFVEIVLSNCGCNDMCVVDEVTDTFECSCPSGGSFLIPNNMFDCVKDIIVDFLETEEIFTINGIRFTPLFFEQAVSLFGMTSFAFVDQNAICSIVFFDAHSKPILSSNVLHDQTTDRAFDQLSIIGSSSEAFYRSEYFQYLPTPITVAGGMLLSRGDCQLLNQHIHLTVSTRSVSDTPVLNGTFLQQSNESELLSLAQTVLNISDLSPVTTTEAPVSAVVWALISVGIVFFIVLSAVCLLVSIRLAYSKSKRKKIVLEPRRSFLIQSSNSMVPNSFYHGFSGDDTWTNDRLANQYVPTRPPQRIDQHGYEIISYSELDGFSPGQEITNANQITNSAKYFTTKFGVTAPVHDFTSYNRQREGDRGQLWEYPRGNLVYLRELGEGQFGKVLLMKAKGIANYQGEIPVAVKTLSCRAPNMLEKFIEETNLMKKFCHPNIVSLLGVSSHDVNEDSAPLMILEYMPYGDLRDFLRKNKPETSQSSSVITLAHFFSIGRDVAEALSFLGEQRYVHRDVAARNCLVGPDLSIKIADFGLSRAVQTKDYYKVKGKKMLPVKWMAPESLIYGIFTTSSDVWSYGVLLWEMVTYGEQPLESFTTEDIIKMAETKTLSHPRPPNCPEEIHTVMIACHQHEPKERIGFEEILRTFSKENIEDCIEQF